MLSLKSSTSDSKVLTEEQINELFELLGIAIEEKRKIFLSKHTQKKTQPIHLRMSTVSSNNI